MKIKRYEVYLSAQDVFDAEIKIEKGEVVGFVLNLRCLIKNKWRVVYRVDTAHGYLHEQRFWLSPEPIKLPMFDALSLNYLFNYFKEVIKQNFARFKKYYEERVGDCHG